MRFFITLENHGGNNDAYHLVQQKLKKLIPEVRITDIDKLHLTIAFVGEQPDELQDKIAAVIRKAVEGIPPFTITPAYIDAFPSLHHPKVFWIGVKGDIDKLFLLRERIKDGLTELNLLVDERRFIPHIAIGKLNNFFVDQQLEEKLQQIISDDIFEPTNVSSIHLFESLPNHGFHDHNSLVEVTLK